MAEVGIFIYQAHVLHKTVPSPAGCLISGSDRRVERGVGEAWRNGKREREGNRKEVNVRDEDLKGGKETTRPLPLLSGKYHLGVLQMRLQLLAF